MLMLLFLTSVQPTVHVVWNDAYSLLSPAGYASLHHEVETLFEGYGLRVRVHLAGRGEVVDAYTGPSVNVIVSPGEGEAFGLDPDAMAAAVGLRSKGYSIFVFYPAVRRTLGNPSLRESPRSMSELSRAISRVVAHELIHVLAPERGHARYGLMARKLTRKALVEQTIELDQASRRMAQEFLRGYSELSAGVSLRPPLDGPG